jgi:hypothetical protein
LEINFMDRDGAKGNPLERIRERPPLFLGDRTITGLWHFLHGYSFARQELGAGPSNLLPQDFHDWVAYRLHLRESTSGWRNMILSQAVDEKAALEQFWELLDERHARQARPVAKVREQQKRNDFPPTVFTFVVYTDDPGFFVIAEAPGRISHDTGRFFPSISMLLGRDWKSKVDLLEVFDQVAFDRLIREDEEREQQRREEHEAH